jgi:hypothetical protein
MVVYIYYVNVKQLEIQSDSSWAAPVRATGTVRKGQAVRPVLLRQNHTCWVTLLQTARRAAVLGQPYSLRLHCANPPSPAEAEFLDGIGTKIVRFFILAFHSNLCQRILLPLPPPPRTKVG